MEETWGPTGSLAEELETHPIFAPFIRQCALQSIGKFDPDIPAGEGFMREPHTGVLIYNPDLVTRQPAAEDTEQIVGCEGGP